MIDLHSHTTASDGQYAPRELIARAHRAGIRHLAVTDHDTVAGLAEAREAAAPLGMELISGCELSAFVGEREVHILGHFIDDQNPVLGKLAERLRRQRTERMARMTEKLRGLGYPVTLEQVQKIAGDANLGRPHLALLLMELGYCSSTKDAFSRLLGDGKPGCVPRERLGASEAIDLIRQASGTATLAHPGVSKVTSEQITELAAAGLSGLEAFHADHPPSLREKYLKIAAQLNLVPTAGSDFHGEKVAPNRKLGDAAMPAENLEALRARAGAARS